MRRLLFLFIITGFLSVSCGQAPDDFQDLLNSGKDALAAGNYNKAVNNLMKALELSPSDRDVLYYLGLTFDKLALPDSAHTFLTRAYLLYPRDREINNDLLRICPQVNDYDGALKAIQALIVTGDSEKMHWPALANFNYAVDNMYLAAEYYRKLLAEFPDQPTYHLRLADALARLDKFDESNAALQNACDRFGPNPMAYSAMAFNYASMEKFDKAEEYLRKALELDPDNIPSWVNLGHMLRQRGGPDRKREALGIYRRFLENAPAEFGLDSLIKALEAEPGVVE